MHGEADIVAASIESALVEQRALGVAISFGGGSGSKGGANWSAPTLHTSEIVPPPSVMEAASSERTGAGPRAATTSVLIRRTQDYDSYHVRVTFAAGFELRRVGPHAFVIAPPPLDASTGDQVQRGSATAGAGAATRLWVSVGFAPTAPYGIMRFLPAAAGGGDRSAGGGDAVGSDSRRRDCHFADSPSPSILKHLPKGEGGAAD